MPLDFTSCYYQSSLLSFTAIAQIFQSGQSQHCSAYVCFYTYDTFYVDPCPIVRACVLIDVCVQLLLCMFRGQHKIIPQHSRSKSSTKPPSPFLTCQFKMATRPLLFSRHPIPCGGGGTGGRETGRKGGGRSTGGGRRGGGKRDSQGGGRCTSCRKVFHD